MHDSARPLLNSAKNSTFTDQILNFIYQNNTLVPEPSVNNKLKRREGSGSTGGFFD
jgi:hypothetical protein